MRLEHIRQGLLGIRLQDSSWSFWSVVMTKEPVDIELLDELGDLPMPFDEFTPGYAG